MIGGLNAARDRRENCGILFTLPGDPTNPEIKPAAASPPAGWDDEDDDCRLLPLQPLPAFHRQR